MHGRFGKFHKYKHFGSRDSAFTKTQNKKPNVNLTPTSEPRLQNSIMQPATVFVLLLGVLGPFYYQMVKSSYIGSVNNVFTIDDSSSNERAWIDEEIHGYHFHTYFFQNNAGAAQEALAFRVAIQDRIDNGILRNCRLNNVNTGPRGPHPIGSYETCCNKTSISPAISFFMQNRGNLSILLHALTRYEVADHTTRSMFLGPRLPLDTSALREDLEDNLDLCLPL